MRSPAPVKALFLLVGLMLISTHLAAGYCLSCGQSLDHEACGDFCNACYMQMHLDTSPATANDQETVECCICREEFTNSDNLPACSLEHIARAPGTSDICCLSCCCKTYICQNCLERMAEASPSGLSRCPKCRSTTWSRLHCCYEGCNFPVRTPILEHVRNRHPGLMVETEPLLPRQLYEPTKICLECLRTIPKPGTNYHSGFCWCLRKPRRGYTCIKCQKTKDTVEEVLQHYCDSHLPTIYMCTLCNTAVTGEEASEQHLLEHCVYICPYIRCQQRFYTRAKLWLHIASAPVRRLFASEPATAAQALEEEQGRSLEVEEMEQLLGVGGILPYPDNHFENLPASSDEALAWQLQRQYVPQVQPLTQERFHQLTQETQEPFHQPIQETQETRETEERATPCGQCCLCRAMLYEECPYKQ